MYGYSISYNLSRLFRLVTASIPYFSSGFKYTDFRVNQIRCYFLMRIQRRAPGASDTLEMCGPSKIDIVIIT